METVVILLVAAGLSAAVVWWAMAPPDPGRTRTRAPRRRAAAPAPAEDAWSDGFVLLPADTPAMEDDRPAAALSLIRIIFAIAIVAAFVVAVIGAVGWLLKLELDQYFVTA